MGIKIEDTIYSCGPELFSQLIENYNKKTVII